MSLLSNLTTDTNIKSETDSLGGSRARESGLYPLTVDMAYLTKASSEALALNLVLKDANGEVKSQLWMTSGKEKGCKNYYEDKDGNKQYLPGFNMANALCLLTVGKEISQMQTEQKLVKIYNYDAKSEVPTQVEVLVDLIGQPILVGLLKQVVDKNIKTDAGYVPSGETREENEIDKLFRASDRKTVTEIRSQAETAVFADQWAEKWTGKVKDKTSKTTGKAGAPKPAGLGAAAPGKPTSSLFGDN